MLFSLLSPSPIEGVLQPFIDRHEIAGAVTLVADRDQILGLETFGYADIANKKPMQRDSLFWIASMTKPITGTALMMLVDEGKVNVSDPVEKYLPEFAGQLVVAVREADHVVLKKPNHPFTVAEALNHTAGWQFLTPVENPYIDNLSLEDQIKMYAMLPLQTEPGAEYVYSNIGINIAGRIVEVVSGQLFEDFLQERLFGPLGMTDTTFWPSGEQLERLAKSYKPNEAGDDIVETPVHYLRYPLDDRSRFGTPGGGLFSTALDIARFIQMILRGGEFDGHRFISEASIREMTSRHTTGEQQWYGLGWGGDENTYGHGGAYATNMNVHRASELAFVYMVQNHGFIGEGGSGFDTFRNKWLESWKG